ncbi:Hypothetical predicted protein [Mytilus galloprovincialis]|uniref:C-type lectin domain-containing protein n=1 Tax=Mytilus galloprovincialis TaxID=29158 RepID=A0A8B6F9X2_MYTGA|nr:Hypothetical predicted protein [Mytilus galloprovincialis]
MKKNTSTFRVKSGETIMLSCASTDIYTNSRAACTTMCLLHDKCCVASFSKELSICRLDITENCCVVTENATGWSVLTRNQYIPATCAGCISFGNSMYSIVEDYTEWEKAKENCKCLGGKLVEMETSEENEFIKNEVRTRNTGVKGYWIGGYNFNQDDDMEWISKPNQVMPFSDMASGQPNRPTDQLCMGMWRQYDFMWADYFCDFPASHICEFQYQ